MKSDSEEQRQNPRGGATLNEFLQTEGKGEAVKDEGRRRVAACQAAGREADPWR